MVAKSYKQSRKNMLYENESELYLQDFSVADEEEPEEGGEPFKVPTDEELEEEALDGEVI